ncbi:hypothetical protein H0H92_005632 [Tricholoma furcatifolium]|nr:hypothetical protein H0H92_005632 [Tricholoma furcatifolium]
MRRSTTTLDVDPLAKVLEPPPNETSVEREARLAAEAKAKRVSEEIDDDLEKEKVAESKKAKPLKMLLLGALNVLESLHTCADNEPTGQSESAGMLLILEQTFRNERASWRVVIQLNLVRSVRLILDVIAQAITDPQLVPQDSPLLLDLSEVRMRLAPKVLQVEHLLTRRFNTDGFGHTETIPRNSDSSSADPEDNFVQEVAINSARPWKEALARSLTSVEQEQGTEAVDSSVLLSDCAQDIELLWNNMSVQALLKSRNIHMEEVAGFFLDSLNRVTAPDYAPSDDDVLRARLKTLGVSEHRFKVTLEVSDAAWVPYFDDMDAIVFLAPISAFDQTLQEDPSINRLVKEDSVNIWNYLLKNELLKNTHLILFMNKIDILKAKLEAGIKFSDYVVSFARRERENDVKSVTKCWYIGFHQSRDTDKRLGQYS